MNININYIITTWNLTSIKNVDFDKTYIINVNSIPTLHLYLNKSSSKCTYCETTNYYIRSSKTQRIKHVLSNGSYAEIIFHKRIYYCNNCSKVFSESLTNFISSRGVSIYLEIAILEAMKNLSFTYKMIGQTFHVSDTFVCDIFDKRISVTPLKLPYVLSVDEIYARRLTPTKYCCVLFDPLDDKIIDIKYIAFNISLFHLSLNLRVGSS